MASRRSPIKRFIVLIWGENPTFDYYIQPRLADVPAIVVDLSRRSPAPEIELGDGDYVLICRYLDWGWARRIATTRDLAGVGLMFDDDYIAFLGDRSVPLPYRLEVARKTIIPLRMVKKQITEVLVSTETLKKRFYNAQATVLSPLPGTQDLDVAPSPGQGAVRIVFHAQLSHLADHGLAADIARGLADLPRIVFDVVGPAKAKRLWAGVPSAQFHDELDWPSYRRRTGRVGADILMAPMFDTPLNQARSSTKAIDAVRMGAAAVFPQSAAYEDLIGSAVLVEGGRDMWISTLRTLLGNRDALQRRAAQLRGEVEGWVDRLVPLSQVLR